MGRIRQRDRRNTWRTAAAIALLVVLCLWATLEKGSPWVYRVLFNNVWSSSNKQGGRYNNFLLQPFLNYNFPGGMYLTTSPIVTATGRPRAASAGRCRWAAASARSSTWASCR